jgi:cytochrome b
MDANNSSARLRVWDLPTRVFHWTLVAAFGFAFISGESDNGFAGHARAGFLILGLVAFRILWGFVGTRYSRFSALSLSPVQAIDYLRRLPTASRRRYLGHNPAASWAVVGLLGLVTATALTGWRMQATGSEALEEVHEVLAQATLALVIVHVVGALVSSYFHRENLIGAMITGWKKRLEVAETADAEGSRWGVAVALGLAFLVFVSGLVPLPVATRDTKGDAGSAAADHDDDDD